MKLSIIYVYFNTPREIEESVKSIPEACKKNSYEIIIVDNKSPKKLPVVLVENKKIKIIRNNINKGFGSGCNRGARGARGEYLLFLNPDTILSENSIDVLMLTFKYGKKIGIVGPRMIDSNNQELPTINSFINFTDALVVYSFINKFLPNNPISKKFWLLEVNRMKKQKVDVISGACMLVKKDIFSKVGGFDERFFMYFEEQDLCLRVSKLSYKTIFNPKSTITHVVGASQKDKAKIRNSFEKSRYEYIKKHFGLPKAIVVEFMLRFLTLNTLMVAFPVLLSLFLNLFRQDVFMLFIGDAARDFLAARDMILTGNIPIVGIPSSAAWLHQGPIAVWLIGVAFPLSNFNPISPAILFGFIGAITTGLVGYLGKKLFHEKVGIVAAFLYASSPFIVVNARMPYHTSLIPFFTTIFFIVLVKTLRNRKMIPLLSLCFGLLLLVELSNIVVFGVVLILYYFSGIRLNRQEYFKAIIGFFLGILPFIIYEFQNGITYLKFPLWIANRIRLFFIHANTEAGQDLLGTTGTAVYQEITGAIVPSLPYLSVAIFVASLVIIFYEIKKSSSKINFIILFLWIVIPLIAFVLHSAPGQAYFTLLFPAISISLGYLMHSLFKANKIAFFLTITSMVVVNIFGLIKNDFYVRTQAGAHLMPPTGYSLGDSWKFADNASKAISRDANGRPFTLIADGRFKLYKTSLDPYIFLTWKNGGNYSISSKLAYIITDKNVHEGVKGKLIYTSSIENVIKK